jgi:hypothetical protein
MEMTACSSPRRGSKRPGAPRDHHSLAPVREDCGCRASGRTSQPFTNPNAPAAPPQIPAWAHKPLENCAKLVAMTSPGGCANEDVVVLTRQ